MAITIDDFSKIWASTSPLTPYEFSESNYKEGWNFIGGTPPSRQMWDFLQKNNDEKMQYLANNYLPLSGGTITGNLDITGDLDIVGDSSVTGDLDVTGAITGNSVTSNNVNVKSGSVAPVNTLQRSTAYSVDDIVYTSELNAKYYLLCVSAGTTSATMPSFSGAESNTEVTDGTVVWRVQTVTSQENVDDKTKTVDLSNSATITVTSGSVTIEGKTFYQVGNIIFYDVALKATANLSIGNTVQLDLSGIPDPLLDTTGSGFASSSIVLCRVTTSNSFIARILANQVNVQNEFNVRGSYPIA